MAVELAEILKSALWGEKSRAEGEGASNEEQWLRASQVAKVLHVSPSWVKQHDGNIPASSMRRGVRNARYYLWNDNTKELFTNQF